MSNRFERAKSRLDNLQAIEPLLGALRTMSMGAMQMAQNKLETIQQHEDNYNHILAEILPHLNLETTLPLRDNKRENLADTIVLIIGSERGLCGKFNENIAKSAEIWLQDQGLESYQVWAMGSRMVRTLEKMDIKVSWRNPLPVSGLTSYQQAYAYTQNWLDQYEHYKFDHFYILFNQKYENGPPKFTIFRIFPYDASHSLSMIKAETEDTWPPPIIETDPQGIYNQIIQHYISSSLHQILLKSAVAEHSARYNLMEEARNNAEDIIDELEMLINIERKRKITQEMQELASASGLLDR